MLSQTPNAPLVGVQEPKKSTKGKLNAVVSREQSAAEIERLTRTPRPDQVQAWPSNAEIERKLADVFWKQELRDFFTKSYPKLVSFAIKRVRSREDAEDLVSTTFIEFLQRKKEEDRKVKFFWNALDKNCSNLHEHRGSSFGNSVRFTSGPQEAVSCGVPELRFSNGDRLPTARFAIYPNRRRELFDAGAAPIDVAIEHRLAIEEASCDYETAKKHPEFRKVKRRRWWKQHSAESESCPF